MGSLQEIVPSMTENPIVNKPFLVVTGLLRQETRTVIGRRKRLRHKNVRGIQRAQNV